MQTKLSEEERRRIETILDRHLYPEREKQWETKCRVCGKERGHYDCSISECGSPFTDGYWDGKRADDPLPHTTSDAQMREDRERLPEEFHPRFIQELYRITAGHFGLEIEFALVHATPEQQAIAMARAFGEKVEG